MDALQLLGRKLLGHLRRLEHDVPARFRRRRQHVASRRDDQEPEGLHRCVLCRDRPDQWAADLDVRHDDDRHHDHRDDGGHDHRHHDTGTTTTGTTIGTTTGTTIGTTTGTTTTTAPPPPPPVTTPLGTSLPARIAEWSGTGNTYYVDAAAGSDSYTEAQARNESTPWKTIQKAVNSYALPASGHVRILVKNGTYRAAGDSNAVQATVTFANLGSRTPSAGSVLNLMAYPGHSPVVQEPPYAGSTPGNAERHGFWFGDTSARFIRVRGFRVTQNTAAMNQAQGFRIDSSSDIEIDQCEISGWKSAAVGNNPRAQGVYIGSGSTRVHLYNLVVHDIGNPATEATNLSHGFYIQGSHHVLANDSRTTTATGSACSSTPAAAAARVTSSRTS